MWVQALQRALGRLNFARLNHILIPEHAADRDRWRASRLGRLVRPFGLLYEALTLEGQVMMVTSILAGAASLDVQGFDGHLFWAPLTAVQLLSLVAGRAYVMTGVTLEVSLPARVVADEEVRFTLTLRNRSDRDVYSLRVNGPFLPWDGRWTTSHAGIALLPAGETSSTTLTARFSRRGEHHLDPFRVGALVPLGLAQGPAVRSAGCRFMVVPRIARVERIETPLCSRHQPGGVARVLHTGESMDLRGIREYRIGDATRDLHARSWARTGIPVVREYQQEYFRRVAVIVDTDAQGIAPDDFEAAISLAAGLVGALSREDALVDLLVLGMRAHDLTPGRGSLDTTLDLLACTESADAFDADALEALLRPFAPRLSSALVVTCRWDANRAVLVDHLGALNVGTRALVVRSPRAPALTLDARCTLVDADAVRRGERLAL